MSICGSEFHNHILRIKFSYEMLNLIVATDRSRSMHWREFHRRGSRLKYECLEALDVALECLSLKNVAWRVRDELKQTNLEIMK